MGPLPDPVPVSLITGWNDHYLICCYLAFLFRERRQDSLKSAHQHPEVDRFIDHHVPWLEWEQTPTSHLTFMLESSAGCCCHIIESQIVKRPFKKLLSL